MIRVWREISKTGFALNESALITSSSSTLFWTSTDKRNSCRSECCLWYGWQGHTLQKIRATQLSQQLITYLREYYFERLCFDRGIRSTTLYLSHGLCQGCNLSAILFVIYLSELGRRIHRTGLGMSLSADLLLAYLLFADDIFLVGTTEEELQALKRVLEMWCIDFWMKIGPKKTNLITPFSNCTWSVLDNTNGDLVELATVDDYKYLGVHKKLTLRRTANEKCRSMIFKANQYAKTSL